MKRTGFLIFSFFLTIAFKAGAQDYILLPENFTLHKGDNLSLHMIKANQFVKEDEVKYEGSETSKFTIGVGKAQVDLTPLAKKDAVPAVTFKVEHEGLNMISLVRKSISDDIDRDDFIKILDDEGMTKESEKAKNGSKDSFTERYTWFLKSLVKVDNNAGNGFEKPLNEEYEIILKDNPYKGNYGDDIIAQVRLRGKPIANVAVILYIKAANNSIFAQKLFADKEGQVYFKLTREGVYMLRSAYIESSKDKKADFETWMTTYTFAFNSSNEMPNTYKEFGFGDKH